jgi:NAD(P)-dependent dehydrogenase (short-subunit alcohol dehydrogenase family)
MSGTVIITGAGGNLGTVITSALIDAGWKVHAAFRNEAERAHLSQTGIHGLSSVICDITNAEDVHMLYNTAPGEITAVIHLVGGIAAGKSMADTTDEMFDVMHTLNMKTTFLILRQAMRRMHLGGSIITIGARAALHPEKNKSAYAAAKAAVISLTLTAAEEGRTLNIRANCIVPGIIRTPANLEWARNGEEKDWTPPQDIADAILYLISPAAKGVTGTVIPMYGNLPG